MDKIIIPSKQQVEWSTFELGAILHYDVTVHEPSYEFRNQRGYHPDPGIVNPTNLNTDQWVESAANAGIKYIVLVAKHCTGFCLWPTKEYEYSIKNTPYKDGKGDIVKEFIESCEKYGVKPGLYYSSSCNAFCNVDNPGSVLSGNADEQKRYNQIVENQLTELWTQYGDLFEIWFDGGCLPVEEGGPDIISLLNKYQPNAVVFQGPKSTKSLIRWVGNEDGVAPENCWSTTYYSDDNYDGTTEYDNLHGDPSGDIWSPGECDVPLRSHEAYGGGWFWRKDEEQYVYSAEHFLNLYYKSVGRNTNMLIGLVVDEKGLIPDKDVQTIKELNILIKKQFKTKLGEVYGNELIYQIDTRGKPIFNIQIMEDIEKGQRVLGFEIYGILEGKKELIFCSECVGHKRLVKMNGELFDKIELIITKYKDTPYIKSFAVFC